MRQIIGIAALMSLCVLIGGGAVSAAAESPSKTLSYHLVNDVPLRYRLTANIYGTVPIMGAQSDSPLTAVLTIVYQLRPKAVLADGSMDIDFKGESADAEIEGIPFPIDPEQAQQLLNQSATLSRTGEILKTKPSAALPFSVTVPGVDPRRLYSLLFPVVFSSKAVKVGDKWAFPSQLISGEGAKVDFTGHLQAPKGKLKNMPEVDEKGFTAPTGKDIHRLGETINVVLQQKLDNEKKPVKDDSKATRTRNGKITGEGIYYFDQNLGYLINGVLNMRADILEKVIGEPANPNEPKELVSKVKVRIVIQLIDAKEIGQAAAEGK